ncbi:hypothetical protein ACJX0J_040367, partial [Zea mays]
EVYTMQREPYQKNIGGFIYMSRYYVEQLLLPNKKDLIARVSERWKDRVIAIMYAHYFVCYIGNNIFSHFLSQKNIIGRPYKLPMAREQSSIKLSLIKGGQSEVLT